MMRRRALQPILDWAEDTALLRSNRSADPVAETEQRAVTARSAPRPSSPLRDRHQSVKPSRQDAATAPRTMRRPDSPPPIPVPRTSHRLS